MMTWWPSLALDSYGLKVVVLARFTENSFVGREVIHEKKKEGKRCNV